MFTYFGPAKICKTVIFFSKIKTFTLHPSSHSVFLKKKVVAFTFNYCITHSYLVSDIAQYHQLPDEYFTSAVVLSLILAALFGLVYLLIIPQYVQKTLLLPLLISITFHLSTHLFN